MVRRWNSLIHPLEDLHSTVGDVANVICLVLSNFSNHVDFVCDTYLHPYYQIRTWFHRGRGESL